MALEMKAPFMANMIMLGAYREISGVTGLTPGNVGFLNQFFSVQLVVSNVAPEYANLVVRDLKAEIVLPTGDDTVIDTGDDPLRMARLGDPPAFQDKVQAFAECYRNAQAHNPQLNSEVIYLLVINPDGTVKEVHAISSTSADAWLMACHKAIIEALRFPSLRKGTAEVTLKIVHGNSS